VTLIQKHNGGLLGDAAGGGGGGLSPQALVALLNNSGGQRFSAGGAPNEPLYVATQEVTWKTQAWRFVRNGVSLFLLLSFVGAIMDEKGDCDYPLLGLLVRVHNTYLFCVDLTCQHPLSPCYFSSCYVTLNYFPLRCD
jgi:hypothetical protein